MQVLKNTSKVFCVRDFIDGWMQRLDKRDTEKFGHNNSEKQLIMNQLNIPEETYRELAEDVCAPEKLLCGLEPSALFLSAFLTDKKPANTYGLESIEQAPSCRTPYQAYRDVYLGSSMPAVTNAENALDEAGQGPFAADHPAAEAVLTVQFCYPFRRTATRRSTPTKPCVHMVVEFRSSQLLTELRDSIRCIGDYSSLVGDLSENPDAEVPAETKASVIFKSSMIFIEGVFYDDDRVPDEQRVDYSAPVLEWASGHGFNYTRKPMTEVRLVDLSIRLGQPYLFQHLGNCEHLIVFSDIRMMNLTVDSPIDFPRVRFHKSGNRTWCQCCRKLTACWAVIKSPVAPRTPAFLCRECHLLLHYDKNGKKIGSFSAYPHVDGVII